MLEAVSLEAFISGCLGELMNQEQSRSVGAEPEDIYTRRTTPDTLEVEQAYNTRPASLPMRCEPNTRKGDGWVGSPWR